MAIDFQVRRTSRRCAATGREFAPGEAFVATLIDDGREVVRLDFAADAWAGPDDSTVAWWRAETPRDGGSPAPPGEALLQLLDEWADQPHEAAARYLLALLLVRRRVLRIDGGGFLDGLQGHDRSAGAATLRLVCRERPEPIEVAIAPPSPADAPLVERRLAELLGAA